MSPKVNPKKTNNKVTIEVPSDRLYVKKASDKIIESLKGAKLSDTDIFYIKLCVEEAVRNAMEYGNKFKKDIPVKVSCALSRSKLEISVEDKGEGFDYKKVPDPTKDENIMRGGGRGVFLIRNLMDKVKYNEKGNIITMVKKLN